MTHGGHEVVAVEVRPVVARERDDGARGEPSHVARALGHAATAGDLLGPDPGEPVALGRRLVVVAVGVDLLGAAALNGGVHFEGGLGRPVVVVVQHDAAGDEPVPDGEARDGLDPATHEARRRTDGDVGRPGRAGLEPREPGRPVGDVDDVAAVRVVQREPRPLPLEEPHDEGEVGLLVLDDVLAPGVGVNEVEPSRDPVLVED